MSVAEKLRTLNRCGSDEARLNRGDFELVVVDPRSNVSRSGPRSRVLSTGPWENSPTK